MKQNKKQFICIRVLQMSVVFFQVQRCSIMFAPVFILQIDRALKGTSGGLQRVEFGTLHIYDVTCSRLSVKQSSLTKSLEHAIIFLIIVGNEWLSNQSKFFDTNQLDFLTHLILSMHQKPMNSIYLAKYHCCCYHLQANDILLHRIQAITKLPDEIIYGSEYLQVRYQLKLPVT